MKWGLEVRNSNSLELFIKKREKNFGTFKY